MAERMKAWQCIGCGRLEGQRPCVGICEDRPVELVSAGDFEAFEALVRELATITPRDGAWEKSYLALQARARALMGRAK